MASRPDTDRLRHPATDEYSNPLREPTIGDVILARFSRREALRGLSAVAALATLSPTGLITVRGARAQGAPPLAFEEVPHGNGETHAVPQGYEAQTLIRWGDPVEKGAPGFRSAEADGGSAGPAVGLQQRLRRLDAAAGGLEQRRPRAALRQLRIHRHADDVSRHEGGRTRHGEQGAGRRRTRGARPRHRRDPPRRRDFDLVGGRRTARSTAGSPRSPPSAASPGRPPATTG